MTTLNPYGKVNEADQERLLANQKSRKKIAIISIFSIILAAIIVISVVVATHHKNGGKSNGQDASISNTIQAICNLTLYPDSCITSLSPLVNSKNIEPQEIYKLSVQVAINELSRSSDDFFKSNEVKNVKDPTAIKALESCQELVNLALDHLNDSLSMEGKSVFEGFDDLRTWLSSAGTYQETCIDQLENTNFSSLASEKLNNSTKYTSNSLAIVTSIAKSIDRLGGFGRRRLLSFASTEGGPEWLSVKDRRLLQMPTSKIEVDVVVAKDGSGRFRTIEDALKGVPEKIDKKYVIYVKKGDYKENVKIEKKQWNVVMIGDGMDATRVFGSLNVVDGTPTFDTATFAVSGKGFIARDMGFFNTAGPSKHQAVALMSTADQSVFYRCKLDAFQDTLYTHSNRQFYKECTILGTVDFIFGNSAVVLQNCNILPRKPNPGQMNIITAQGKNDPNQNTGITIQNCIIKPSGNLNGVNNFLGRPWKVYSTTVYIQNNMDGFIHPNGWLPWSGNSAPDTIFYAEFQNSGPGSSTKNRVKWKGLFLNLIANQVRKFTVKPFINGDQWLPGTGVSFKPGL